MKPIKLKCQTKNYDWGREDPDCMVFKYSGSKQFVQKKYAELWMGNHASGPSQTIDGKPIGEVIKENNINDLVYLFKILSISKPLSIQIHPNKKQAEELHAKDPKNYPDDNDKPEMFLTITPFKALVGFINIEQLSDLLKQQPFNTLKSSTLKSVLEQIMTLPKESIDEMINKIMERKEQFKDRSYIIQKMYDDFGSDIGIIVSFLLRYFELPPGKAFYLQAGQPHAYIEGEILEVMKNSDNVVRLGLTPKYKDVKTLLDIIDYENVNVIPLHKQDNYYQGGILRLYELQGNEDLELTEASIGVILQGHFAINQTKFAEKDIVFVAPGKIKVQGEGKLYLATSIQESK